jgi:hypothetical protein
MTELTNQEYFDKTVKHIIAQGSACKLYNESGSHCLFKCGSKRCAIGYWIPEEHPILHYTYGGMDTLAKHFPELEGVAWPNTEHGYDLACSLQFLHDLDIVGRKIFEERVNGIKEMYNLN